ncbi:hypothetical protein [Paramaledivibacter caminithermalis]|jgi:hypothetical protein|uniref:DUF4355 domain-containing protein n=1 Tax=Paramaledivibacter caminithermalis (strain DSM 15212 / CIP 107654 / DViRD3) TaxID=1121301 RepID=A0A1M6PEG3_PARC5|nr:hypothetical protein [Paramaledivibacter caminithermalis]SHK06333.1 hypothetical protein SAMN02745912_02135 [Paramaledivibacter caminithermalis DSM 15212]
MFNLEKDNYTKEEVTKLLQSETDKVRTEYSKKVKELESKLPPEKSEKELELEKKEQELLAKERHFKVRETLEKNQLPSELAKFLTAEEDVESVVSELSEVLNQHILNNSYKPTSKKNNDGITKEQFAKMGYLERMSLFESNPELYNKLSN